MNGIRSNEGFNISVGPKGKRLIALDELGIVVEEGQPLAPEILEALPMLCKELR